MDNATSDVPSPDGERTLGQNHKPESATTNTADVIGAAAKAVADGAEAFAKGAGRAAGEAQRVADAAGKAAGQAARATAEGANAAAGRAADAFKASPLNISEEQMGEILSSLYSKSLDGIPYVSKSVDELADDYLAKCNGAQEAAESLVINQIIKCGTAGFLTGLGGVITLPVAIPADISSVLYVQMRMVAAVAKISGLDIRSDQVQTFVYVCLTGSAMIDVVKDAGIKVGQKLAVGAIGNISGKTLTAINQKVGFRLITKFGETGAVNLGKLVPVVGGVIGGTFDAATTKVIADNAISLFVKKQVPDEKRPSEFQKRLDDLFPQRKAGTSDESASASAGVVLADAQG